MPADLQATVERESNRLDQLTLRVQDLSGGSLSPRRSRPFRCSV